MFRRCGHARCGSIELASGGGDTADNVTDAIFEFLRHAHQFLLARFRVCLAAGKEFVEFVTRPEKDRERAGKIANLVGAMGIGYGEIAIAVREAGHVRGDLQIRFDDMPEHEPDAGNSTDECRTQYSDHEYLCGCRKGRHVKSSQGEGGDYRHAAEREGRCKLRLICKRLFHQPAAPSTHCADVRGVHDLDICDFAREFLVVDQRTMSIHPGIPLNVT